MDWRPDSGQKGIIRHDAGRYSTDDGWCGRSDADAPVHEFYVAAGLVFAILCMSMYSAQALHYAVMEEGSYPVETMGAATFIITPLGYGAESVMPLFNGWCLSTFDGVLGYRYMFGGFLVLLAIGFIACLIFRACTKERRAELARLRKEDKNK